MSKHSWSETKIYKALTERKTHNSKAILNLLERPTVMQQIETILDLGSTTPKDFTLHDSAHSFRVAERMWELMPDGTKQIISDYALGILLLSAYLHDIGMSPEFEKVKRHLVYLTERKDVLSKIEVDEFQKWIDDDVQNEDLDIRSQFITEWKRLNYVLSHYIRHRHNDWGGEWIQKHLSAEQLENYSDWVSDLILVCKSHHQGLEHLLQDVFDPRPIAFDNLIHLRYLAMCLRVADVMENDPERTPGVLLSHRQISPESIKFWLKDHPFRLLHSENGYTVYARPPRAFIHKAVEETATQIENELKLCDELIRRKPLAYSPSMMVDGYEWNVVPFVKRDIQPDKKAYEYIEGGFRPDTSKLLELLGGHQLYGNAIWAYRELLQNSFDAIKEQIAWQIINKDLAVEEYMDQIGKMYAIDISMVKKDDGVWLICRDQGVGMTKGIIEQYFLHSGVSKRHEIKELERECQKRGFCLGRTGQFGIGVLSYFMLANKLVILTRREAGTGYAGEECIGWRFEINGTHDFGELARCDYTVSGTEIHLKLNEQIGAVIEEWDPKFDAFLKDNIQRIPCVLRYRSFLGRSANIGPGWTNSDQDIRIRIGKQFEDEVYYRRMRELKNAEKGLSSKARNRQMEMLSQVEGIVIEMVPKIKFLVESGNISDSIKYRIYIPYFSLMHGNSYIYLAEKLKDGNHLIMNVGYGYCWYPDLAPNFSLKGVQTFFAGLTEPFKEFSFVHIEVDIAQIDESKLSVSRDKVQIDKGQLEQIHQFLSERISDLIHANVHLLGNRYDTLNCLRSKIVPEETYWAFDDETNDDNLVWRSVKYPIFTPEDEEYATGDMILNGEKINMLEQSLLLSARRQFRGSMNLFSEFEYKFECELGLMSGYSHSYKPHLILSRAPTLSTYMIFNEVGLPAAWAKVLLIGSDLYGDAVNKNHFLFGYYKPELLSLFYNGWDGKVPLDERVWPDLSNKSECLAFLLFALSYDHRGIWLVTCEHNPAIGKGILSSLGVDEVFRLGWEDLTILTFGRSDTYRELEEIEKFLPRIENQEYFLRKA
jgi:hypothetical protein